MVAADRTEKLPKPRFFSEARLMPKERPFQNLLALNLFAFDQFSALAATYYVASLGGSYGKVCRLGAKAA
jgi:hypothetical protein